MNEQIDWGAIDASFKEHQGSAIPERIDRIQPAPGSYQASIHRVEAVARNGKPTISWYFRIVGGAFEGSIVRKTTWLDTDNPKSMAGAARDLVGVGHEGSPSSFIQSADRYTDSIVNITIKSNDKKPEFPWVYIDGLARKPVQTAPEPTGVLQLPSGVALADTSAFNDEDIPF